MANVNDGCLPLHGQTDAGRLSVGVIWQAAAAVLAAANAVASAAIADKQFDLARQYYRIARNWRDWYNQAFAPLEDAEADEVLAAGPAEAFYDTAAGRALALARTLYLGKIQAAQKCYSQYETGQRGHIIKKYLGEKHRVLEAGLALGWRNERARVDGLNERRWTRMIQAAQRGRDMMAQNVTAGQYAGKIYGDLARQAGSAAGGYMNFLGYSQARLTGGEGSEGYAPARFEYAGTGQAYNRAAREYSFDGYSNWTGPGSGN
jgi:hypothetical protein